MNMPEDPKRPGPFHNETVASGKTFGAAEKITVLLVLRPVLVFLALAGLLFLQFTTRGSLTLWLLIVMGVLACAVETSRLLLTIKKTRNDKESA